MNLLLGKVLGQPTVVTRAGLMVLSYLVMLVAGVFGAVPVFLVAALAALAAEFDAIARTPLVGDLLRKIGIGRVYRDLARDVSVVLLLITTVDPGRGQLILGTVLLATVWACGVVANTVGTLVDRRLPTQALTRNIKLGPLRKPPSPPSWAIQLSGDRLPFINNLGLAGVLVTAAVGTAVPFLISMALAAAGAILVAGAITLTWLLGRRPGLDTSVLPALQTWLDTQRPQVAIYFAGPAKDVYQANMWLGPVEEVGRPGLVILRSREAFTELARTRLPVICVPSSVDFMNLTFGSMRAVLYPANVGANIHMLREPGMKHVFVGHGDSDKQASVNPYSKVYDEVWVAGLAGRERYARAAVGVLDSDIVEIGRPQLAGVETFASGTGDRPFTVLYAPTWEGWLDDPYHTSLTLMGESIVRGLLALGPSVRVIYKPHPLTGSVSPKAAVAHARVVELIRAAGGQTDASTLDGSGHRVVSRPTPGLFACFNETDLLISDISSVVADFVQSQRPYVVANPAGLPEDEFRRTYPTARAAYLLSVDCGELEKIVTVARTGDDPLRDARRELKTYLLGPAEVNPQDRFRAEISRLCG